MKNTDWTTVSQLITELQAMPPDAPVYLLLCNERYTTGYDAFSLHLQPADEDAGLDECVEIIFEDK